MLHERTYPAAKKWKLLLEVRHQCETMAEVGEHIVSLI